MEDILNLFRHTILLGGGEWEITMVEQDLRLLIKGVVVTMEL